jgi:hypothetical protein
MTNSKRPARLAAMALTIAAATAAGSSGASAAAPVAGARTDAALAARPYRAAHLAGVTTGTYTVSRPAHGILITLQMTGRLTSSGGCYTAQVGVRQSSVWKFSTVATNCSTLPVPYQVSVSAITSLSAAFGVRVCAVGGGCGAVTPLPQFGIAARE